MLRIYSSLLFLFISTQIVYSQSQTIHIKITDEHNNPTLGVYVIHKRLAALLATSDINGNCSISPIFRTTDTIQFQGMRYEITQYCITDLKKNSIIRLKKLEYELSEALIKGIKTEDLLKIAITKLRKQKNVNLALCRYYGTAQYEKITQCRDTIVEYRREYGLYFTSGDILPKNTWDRTFRSYLVPEYMARSFNLTIDGCDTISPISLTSEDIRFDIGTRKIFTLMHAVQLFGPLFNGIKDYDIHASETNEKDYTFTFKTRPESYPNNTRISCKGTFSIDREKQELKNMTFNYIDYHLLRQVLLSNNRNIDSPFSTHAILTFANDSSGQNYIRSCEQTSQWKYNLGTNFIIIEQPSRHQPGYNRLIEHEAFFCYDWKKIKPELQTSQTLAKIHLAQRYPTGIYDKEIFGKLPYLISNRKVKRDLSRYMALENQFTLNNGKAYYPENYILEGKLDSHNKQIHRLSLEETRQRLFQSFGHCPVKESPIEDIN